MATLCVEGKGNTTHWAECSEKIAREDYANRKITSEEIIDGGILAPEEKVIIPFNMGANKIVDAEIPEGIKASEYKYIDGEFVINYGEFYLCNCGHSAKRLVDGVVNSHIRK